VTIRETSKCFTTSAPSQNKDEGLLHFQLQLCFARFFYSFCKLCIEYTENINYFSQLPDPEAWPSSAQNTNTFMAMEFEPENQF